MKKNTVIYSGKLFRRIVVPAYDELCLRWGSVTQHRLMLHITPPIRAINEQINEELLI